jgi:hypothetical protein
MGREAMDPLVKYISPVLAYVFPLYITFGVLAVLNVVTNVFVETSLLSAKNDEELKGNMVVVLEAVKNSGDALRYASKELKGDRDVVMEAVKIFGDALRFASEELKGNMVVVMVIVNKNGDALRFASKELKGNRFVGMEAVKEARSCACICIRGAEG